MFSERLPELLKLAEDVGTSNSLPPERLTSLLEACASGRGLEPDEIVELMRGTLEQENRNIILDFAARYQRPRERDILLLPPLYFATKCENSCLYCHFSSQGGRLSLDEFLDELEALTDLGYRSIELVSSQDPELYQKGDAYSLQDQRYEIHRLLPYFREAKKALQEKGGGMLTSNIPPIDPQSLRELKSVGLDCYLLWVETFHPGQYAALHRGNTPKANQAFRLDSLEHAAEVGIAHIAGAFLKGLYDWRTEEVLLYAFDRLLKSRYGKGFSIIGTPRLKGPFTQAELVRSYRVSDADYELNIALDRILFDGINWLQTREDPRMNMSLIDRYGGGVILTLDCSTALGGYSAPATTQAQFPVYRQNLKEAVQDLERAGYNAIFDWDPRTLSGFQRQ
jgi:2-iminoacetate synthase ThiH